jgi:hypothetical protein
VVGLPHFWQSKVRPAAAASTTNEAAQCVQAKTMSLLGSWTERAEPPVFCIEIYEAGDIPENPRISAENSQADHCWLREKLQQPQNGIRASDLGQRGASPSLNWAMMSLFGRPWRNPRIIQDSVNKLLRLIRRWRNMDC